MLRAEGKDGDSNWNSDEGTKQPPYEWPEEYGEQQDEGRDGKRAPRDARLDITADDELDNVQTGEDREGRLPRGELGQCEQGRKHRGDERPDDGDVVQSEGDDPPFDRKRQPGKRGEGPDQRAGHQAH